MNTKNNPVTEVRFAVVLYGGISLAIYINGVVQELYKMVRATAKENAGKKLSGSEAVYRDIGEALGVRFVIDVISGTSAGGINGVYLAKALVNDQELKGIEKLWITEGDIGSLINDRKSNEGLPDDLKAILNAKPRKSLLNGQRMYYKLLKALDDMDKENIRAKKITNESPYVKELDLFITATDLHGLINPIRLSKQVTYESRHRSVFHFRYSNPKFSGEDRNDFYQQDNPYLAFAARCTSSLPFAFEPMTLRAAQEVLGLSEFKISSRDLSNNKETWEGYAGDFNTYEQGRSETGGKWMGYFADYAKRGYSFKKFAERPFGDGGYLDNKPLSYATDTILNRYADRSIDRKLIYVEPAPEHPEDDSQNDPQAATDITVPDALENTLLALTSLPRSEPISEDIEYIKQRNQIIERVRNYQKYAIEGLIPLDKFQGEQIRDKRKKAKQDETYTRLNQLWDTWESKGADYWPDMDLNESIDKYGYTYYNYHHVRVALTTDNLARLVTRAMGKEKDSETFTAIRMLLQAWRGENYGKYKKEAEETENSFMYKMDIDYRIRRLRFLLQLLSVLTALDSENTRTSQDDIAKAKAFLKVFEIGSPEYETLSPEKTGFADFQTDINTLRSEINDILYKVIYYNREMQHTIPSDDIVRFNSKGAGKHNKKFIKELENFTLPNIKKDQIETILKLSLDTSLSYDERRMKLLKVVDGTENFFDTLREITHHVLRATSEDCKEFFNEGSMTYLREFLRFYYYRFDYFDVMSLPLIAGTAAAEADIIDIIRISPEDSPSDIYIGDKRKKLKGTKFGNFGGFFSSEWRQEDILWGQLDAAEIVIRSLTGYTDEASLERWAKDALAAILEEKSADPDIPFMTGFGEEIRLEEKLNRIQAVLKNGGKPQEVNQAITNILDAPQKDTEKVLAEFSKMYKANPDLPADQNVSNATRAVQVIGKVFEDLSDKYTMLKNPAVWFTRLGMMTSGLVELTLPNSILNILARHWFKLLYIAEALLLGVSYLFGWTEIRNPIWAAILVTAAVHLATVTLNQVFKRQPYWFVIPYLLGGLIAGTGYYFSQMDRDIDTLLTQLGNYLTWSNLIMAGWIVIILTVVANLVIWSRRRKQNLPDETVRKPKNPTGTDGDKRQ